MIDVDITPEVMRLILRYNPQTGKLYWNERPENLFNATAARSAASSCKIWNGRFAGKEALTHLSKFGYLQGRVFGRGIQAHRAAWVVHFGAWPKADIDHINGARNDNRLVNLRSVSRAENLKNRCVPGNNTSGWMGVKWCKSTNSWMASITCDGTVHWLGRHKSKQDAIEARQAAERVLGFHENHGRIRDWQGETVLRRLFKESGEPQQEALF